MLHASVTKRQVIGKPIKDDRWNREITEKDLAALRSRTGEVLLFTGAKLYARKHGAVWR